MPFNETDAPGPVSVYGISKLAGEYCALAASPENLVIRTCGLYGVWGTGGKGGNFVETMLRVAGQGKPLKVVNDQHCSPTYTADLAEATVGLIRAGASGLFHVTNAGGTTWHDFAAEVFRLGGVSADLSPIPTSARNDPVQRPFHRETRVPRRPRAAAVAGSSSGVPRRTRSEIALARLTFPRRTPILAETTSQQATRWNGNAVAPGHASCR
jgi:dTDP-4-dehydrorhamnose reductase